MDVFSNQSVVFFLTFKLYSTCASCIGPTMFFVISPPFSMYRYPSIILRFKVDKSLSNISLVFISIPPILPVPPITVPCKLVLPLVNPLNPLIAPPCFSKLEVKLVTITSPFSKLLILIKESLISFGVAVPSLIFFTILLYSAVKTSTFLDSGLNLTSFKFCISFCVSTL